MVMGIQINFFSLSEVFEFFYENISNKRARFNKTKTKGIIIKLYLKCTPQVLLVDFVICTQFLSLEYKLGWVDQADTCTWNITEKHPTDCDNTELWEGLLQFEWSPGDLDGVENLLTGRRGAEELLPPSCYIY